MLHLSDRGLRTVVPDVLCFADGFLNRALPNEDRHVQVNILACDAYNSACAVKLLVIYALRIRAVAATT